MTAASAPPPNMNTTWAWIGDDALKAGVLGVVVHFVTQRSDGTWVVWFQRKESAVGNTYTPLTDFLRSVGCIVYLVIYRDADNPIKLINLKNPNKSYRINRKTLRDHMRKNGQPK